MFSKFKKIFQSSSKNQEEALFLQAQNIQYDIEKGYIVDGIIVNELAERLEYFSNRRMKKFDDLKELFFNAMIINEKIDLELATKKYITRLGNTPENLQQLKIIVNKLSDYYRKFLRDKM